MNFFRIFCFSMTVAKCSVATVRKRRSGTVTQFWNARHHGNAPVHLNNVDACLSAAVASMQATFKASMAELVEHKARLGIRRAAYESVQSAGDSTCARDRPVFHMYVASTILLFLIAVCNCCFFSLSRQGTLWYRGSPRHVRR